MAPIHRIRPECAAVHSTLEANSKFQCDTLTEMKQDLKEIKQKLEAQSNRIWLLYTKIIIVACLSGGGTAGLLKVIL